MKDDDDHREAWPLLEIGECLEMKIESESEEGLLLLMQCELKAMDFLLSSYAFKTTNNTHLRLHLHIFISLITLIKNVLNFMIYKDSEVT